MVKKIGIILLFVVAVGARHALPLQGLAFAATQENGQPCPPECVTDSLEIITYYPSPYGYYEELRGDKIIVGDTDNSRIDEIHLPPSGTLTFEPKSYAEITNTGTSYEGAIYYDSFDHEFKYYDKNNSWQPLGGGGDYWQPSTANTDNIYYNTGNVGIGTATPQAALDITPSLSAKANNDNLTALHINPTFNSGSFSDIRNRSLVVERGNVLFFPAEAPTSFSNYETFEDNYYSPWQKDYGSNNSGNPEFAAGQGYQSTMGLALRACVCGFSDYNAGIRYTFGFPVTGEIKLYVRNPGESGCPCSWDVPYSPGSGFIVKTDTGVLAQNTGIFDWTFFSFTFTNAKWITIQSMNTRLLIDNVQILASGIDPSVTNIGVGTANPQANLDIATGWATLADAWSTRSSLRFKENLYPIDNALAKLNSLQGVYFDYKDTHKHSLGLVAEDVGRVFPELVTYEPDGKNAIALDYDKLSAVTIEAVKEQQKDIEEQEKESSALRKEIQELKETLTKTNRNQQKEIDLLKAKEKCAKIE